MIKNKPRISLGTDNFKKMVTEYDIFVDKSLFIQEVIDSGEEAILITRARRWGKSLNMDMLKTFLSLDVDDSGNVQQQNSNQILFTGSKSSQKPERLKIADAKNGKYILDHQGKYPVISMSFKDIVGNSYQEIETKLKYEIKELFRDYEYLKHSKALSSYEKKDFEQYLEGNISKEEITRGIKFLSQLLYKHHNKKVYILVDEHDKPVNHLLEKEVLNPDRIIIKQVSELITLIFSKCGKSNDALEKIILTGIYDTLKKEGNSGFNNVKVHNFFDHKFSKSFGFSEDEINYIVNRLSLEGVDVLIKQNIKDWYNGYSVPSTHGAPIHVYTPWAVFSYLDDVQSGNLQPKSYWSKSGTSTILQSLIKYVKNSEISTKFRALAEGKEQVLDYEDLTSLLEYDSGQYKNTEKVFSYLLLNSGYLTAKSEGGNYYFKVPNFEVKQEFANVIRNEIERIDSLSNDEITASKDYTETLLKSLNIFEHNIFKQAIYLIIANDHTALEKFFLSTPSFRCFDKNSNFNLLQISAMKGNLDIYKSLLNWCDNKLLSSQINGVKVSDYAYISGHQDIKLVDTSLSIVEPSITEKLMCYPFGVYYLVSNICIISAVTAGIKFVSTWWTPNNLSTAKSLGVLIFTDIVLTLSREVIKSLGSNRFDLCDQYESYQNINTDISKPYKTVAQLEKYVIEHSNTYVTLNSECEKGDSKLSIAEIPIFKYDETDILLFGLCEQPNPFDGL